jgi:hypothetical protein
MQKVPKKPKPDPLSDSVPGLFTQPRYLLLLIVLIIFISEALVMLVLDYLHSLTPYQEMLLDAALLSIITFPSLYILVFRPLRLHISRRRQAEQQKEELIEQLQHALHEVTTLQGILPICSSCKRIRDDKGFWQKVESYIQNHSNVEFSHGLCNECIRKHYPDNAEQIIKKLD